MARREADQIALLIKRDQLASVLNTLPLTLISNTFVSCSLALMMVNTIDHRFLLAWVGTNALINVGRFGAAKAWIRNGWAETHPDRTLLLYTLGSLASGLSWLDSLLFLNDAGQALTAAAGFAFCGINAGATIQTTSSRAAVLSFVLPNSLAFVWILIAEGTLQAQVLGTNMLLLTILMVRASTRTEASFLASSRLKHEATHLAASLRQANVAAAQAVQRLEYVANHDHLTGLANRVAHQQAFEDFLARTAQEAGHLSILLIDLDRFKAINDTFGHGAGDEVLVEVACRLTALLTSKDRIARLGGDEFAVLLFRPEATEDAAIADRIVTCLGEPYTILGQTWIAGASVGFARFPEDGRTVQDLHICADLALYAAKSDGRCTARHFDESMRRSTVMRQVIERDLSGALAAGEVDAWFQPQVACATGEVRGLEALLRWKHPTLGWLSPPDVVRAAVTTGQSEALTRTILRSVCRMGQVLEAMGRTDIVISLNLSPDEFGTYAIARMVADELAGHGIDGTCVAIEITEEAVYSSERCGAEIEALTRMGVRIIIDDFGVGYSSIGSLRKLRFDALKIDKNFVQDICDDEQDRTLIRAILAFARSLGVDVVAEGIETAAQVDILAELGSPLLQGYHFSPAMPQAHALAWITRNDAAAHLTPARPAHRPPVMLRASA